jgi:hypothetical protein
MADFNAPSSLRAIEAFRAGKTAEHLLKLARAYSPKGGDAEGVLLDAMIRVCDPDRGHPWDPELGSFLTHMRIVIRDVARRERRSALARREIADSPAIEIASHPGPAPDEAVSDARMVERLRRLGGILRQRIAHDARMLQVFDRGCEGVEGAAELARLLDCSVHEIYAANRQIARHAMQVLAEDQSAETARMKDLRRAAEKEVTT